MFSMKTLSSATRASKALSFAPRMTTSFVPRRTFSASQCAKKDIHLPTHEVLEEHARGISKDLSREASALEKEVVSQLPTTMKNLSLGGKIALITGGARGLGYNMAQGLAEAGIKGIAILDFQEALGMVSAEKLKADTGVATKFIRVDVRDAAGVADAVAAAHDHFGKLDVVINAAGIADSNLPAETYPDEKFRNLVNINLNGTFFVCREVGKRMIEARQPGSIINIASMSGSIVNYPQQQSCYNASKAGVIQLTKSLAAEWAKYNVRVNSISPGYMDTELNRDPKLESQKVIWKERTPMGRLGDVTELNTLAVFLASDGSSFMTGSDLIIDGGYTLW
ncbi:NAD(P)-binding protein [Microthyrium microscopicum]|uniref:NADP-dependent mannitol dehydrogenase n=1 Tax=Microthyrium microscopicum TaxID=703497 RepID=A0A6A6UHM2_9PEZI|nr:NAD(P)-binding protein [Microthyrium microscopicum]